MTRMHTLILSALCASLVAGCTFMARGPEQYESDTRKVLEERNPQIKACYDALLDREAGIGGNVVVRFTVEKKTGVFKEIRLDNEATTAPESIAQCVLQALQGLTLTPVDQRDGLATFTWTFQAPPAPAKKAKKKKDKDDDKED